MAQDKSGKAVGFGDYLAVDEVAFGVAMTFTGIVRVVKLAETPKGSTAVGAFVDLVGNGRVRKIPVKVGDAVLVMKSDGTAIT